MQLTSRNERGDTIVEVLIAVAIVSLTLTGAYASVNRSSNATRSAQERGEALKWAETQVEQIKASKVDLSAPAYLRFCFDQNSATQSFTLVASNSASCVAPGPIAYAAVIKQRVQGTGDFSIVVTWNSLDSSGTGNVELDYVK